MYHLRVRFPADYPFKPPKIQFETKVYHPNIKTDTGEICNDVLVSNWSPTLNVRYVYTTLHELLKSPNVDHPLEPEIAQEFASDRATFDKKAISLTGAWDPVNTKILNKIVRADYENLHPDRGLRHQAYTREYHQMRHEAKEEEMRAAIARAVGAMLAKNAAARAA